MKIAVFHDLPTGGASRVAYDIVRRLVADHQVDLYEMSTGDSSMWDLSAIASKTHTYRYDPPQHEGWRQAAPVRMLVDYRSLFVELPRIHRQIAADIDGRGYDLVFVQHSQFVQAPYLLGSLRTPSVYMCHEPRRGSFEYMLRPPRDEGRLSYRARLALFEWLHTQRDIRETRAATLVLANSFYSAESIQRAHGVTARVLYPGIDLELFRDLDLPRANTVVSVGGLHPFKGHDLVVAALSHLPSDVRPALQVVTDRGAQAEADALHQLANRLGVDLAILRRLSDEELVETYNRAALTVCAARLEPFGLVPLESTACGTPVVAVREGGFRETVVDDRNGVLVERDAKAMAAGIRRALDPDRWETLHHNALVDCRRWSSDRTAARFVALCEELLADPAGEAVTQ